MSLMASFLCCPFSHVLDEIWDLIESVSESFPTFSQVKILKSHAHLRITGRNSTKFPMNPMKDVEAGDKISNLQSVCRHGQQVYQN